MSPPSDAFVANLERQLSIALLVTASWAWSCLGIFLANRIRHQVVTNAPVSDIFAGRYIELKVGYAPCSEQCTDANAAIDYLWSLPFLWLRGYSLPEISPWSWAFPVCNRSVVHLSW
jgi:hypothetical protein